MIAVLFTIAVVAPVALSGFVAGWVRCHSAPWTRHFWES